MLWQRECLPQPWQDLARVPPWRPTRSGTWPGAPAPTLQCVPESTHLGTMKSLWPQFLISHGRVTSRGTLPTLRPSVEVGGRWGSPQQPRPQEWGIAATSGVSGARGPPCRPAHAGHTGAPTPALARSQPRRPSNHPHGSRTSLFLVETRGYLKIPLPTAVLSQAGSRDYPFLCSRTHHEVDAQPEDTGSLCQEGLPLPPLAQVARSRHLPHPPSLHAGAWHTDSTQCAFGASDPMPFGRMTVGP